ncbi:MAG: Holliday junction branch migration protein RuvA [Gammaproteobacteria bacterium]|nr:Holliday junction branch migration protein RuvA [Gammaproteobacteria bacterium]MDP6616488.1 Holliday junction branch migration protein RuvA [Gammaproteobacteria bacterium]MDP6694263.1 Holliday junction branch migration protein RuvA [Gammaproteobacteria bacterium]MDP7041957.1 Holliday junction branch migration protein RuvA [Gammaproteobacteria bacterium]
MIGFVRGILIEKSPPTLVVDVNGIGYEIEAPMSTCFELPDVGETIHLITHLVVREDQHTLYGFATEAERKLFRNLLRVNRVGAKLALGILSGISVDGFVRCVQEEDQAALSKLPGVGRKTAERLILDMRDRVDEQINVLSITAIGTDGGNGEPRREAFTALTALGYKPAEARRMLDSADAELASTEDILRTVLRSAAPAGDS